MKSDEVVCGLDIGASKWLGVIEESRTGAGIDRGEGLVSDDPEQTLTGIRAWLERSCPGDRRGPVSVACAFAGATDFEGRVCSWPNRPTWSTYLLTAALALEPETKVLIEDDGASAAIGERTRGVARDCGDFLCVSLGTGIGSGIFLDGRLRRALPGQALTLGHFRAGGESPCLCGRRGCLQTLFSGKLLEGRDPEDGEPQTEPEALRTGIHRFAEVASDLVRLLNLKAVVLTGGLLQHRSDLKVPLVDQLRLEFLETECRVLLPDEPSLSAVRGALAMAHHGRRFE